MAVRRRKIRELAQRLVTEAGITQAPVPVWRSQEQREHASSLIHWRAISLASSTAMPPRR